MQEKFESVGGITEVVSERYTSRTCPKCGNIKKKSPKGRIYKCKKCKFEYDRDGVGAINIMKLNVSFNHDEWLDVVGGLTPPIGVKYLQQGRVLAATKIGQSILTKRYVSPKLSLNGNIRIIDSGVNKELVGFHSSANELVNEFIC